MHSNDMQVQFLFYFLLYGEKLQEAEFPGNRDKGGYIRFVCCFALGYFCSPLTCIQIQG